jgi:hypothetical protein
MLVFSHTSLHNHEPSPNTNDRLSWSQYLTANNMYIRILDKSFWCFICRIHNKALSSPTCSLTSYGMTPLITARVHSEVDRTNPELLRHVAIKVNIAIWEITRLDIPYQTKWIYDLFIFLFIKYIKQPRILLISMCIDIHFLTLCFPFHLLHIRVRYKITNTA